MQRGRFACEPSFNCRCCKKSAAGQQCERFIAQISGNFICLKAGSQRIRLSRSQQEISTLHSQINRLTATTSALPLHLIPRLTVMWLWHLRLSFWETGERVSTRSAGVELRRSEITMSVATCCQRRPDRSRSYSVAFSNRPSAFQHRAGGTDRLENRVTSWEPTAC